MTASSIFLHSAVAVLCGLQIFPRFRATDLSFLGSMDSGVISHQRMSKDTVFPKLTNYR